MDSLNRIFRINGLQKKLKADNVSLYFLNSDEESEILHNRRNINSLLIGICERMDHE